MIAQFDKFCQRLVLNCIKKKILLLQSFKVVVEMQIVILMKFYPVLNAKHCSLEIYIKYDYHIFAFSLLFLQYCWVCLCKSKYSDFLEEKKKFRVSTNLVNAHMKQKNYINDSILEVMTH